MVTEKVYSSFEEYWELEGSRIIARSHEERARLAWDAAKATIKTHVDPAGNEEAERRAFGTHPNLCGLSPAPREDDDENDAKIADDWARAEDNGWPGDGSGMDDFADYNNNEQDDYRNE
jgi:hypothetical protein